MDRICGKVVWPLCFVSVGAGPVTEGEWVEGVEGDVASDGIKQHAATGPAQTHDQWPRGHWGGQPDDQRCWWY